MTVYSYQCNNCTQEFDAVLPLAEYDKPQECPFCGGETKKVMSVGGVQTSHPVWLDQSVRNQLQDTDSPHNPIESREQLEKHLKDNGIVPSN